MPRKKAAAVEVPVGTDSTPSLSSPARQTDGDAVESVPTRRMKSSSLVDTRVAYCGDNLEQLRTLPDVRDFGALMTTHERMRRFFIAFDCSQHATQKNVRFCLTAGNLIDHLTVRRILEEQIPRKKG